ncbi:hypothetical protein [Chitinophaga filiformis]|uniref:DUF4595 domain-containing protein n=1 Tax=Chitinophaga filiformis TaxID=104663 RepID=A0A1G7NPM9_CHIFI|nr:hypothetical protein [Chitinophaga filiformis]SDF76045.1 hypothetical protein SAMN04488121_102889 [Chitinophaga filiformis]
MMKLIRIPIALFFVYALSGMFVSCNTSGDGVTPADSIYQPGPGLSAIYINGKISTKIEYRTDGKVGRIYEYDMSDTAKVNPTYRFDYEYNTDGQVGKEIRFSLRSQSVISEAIITYQADSIFSAIKNVRTKMMIIRPDKVTRTGDPDTVYNQNNSSTFNYSIYTMEGNDLKEFFNEDFFENEYMKWDYHYKEKYTYDTTLNPLWPLIKNNYFIARTFLETQYKEMYPFAFTLSKHNPLQIDIENASINLWLPKGVTFEYKLFEGTPYPVEQKWIDRSNGSVFKTYKYEYIGVPE